MDSLTAIDIRIYHPRLAWCSRGPAGESTLESMSIAKDRLGFISPFSSSGLMTVILEPLLPDDMQQR